MLKKYLLTAVTLLLAFLILGVSIFKTCAQTNDTEIATSEAVVDEEGVEQKAEIIVSPKEEKVDYYLPYPGILPDHPLYFLKMIRDRIWLILTTNPFKKAEVLLLFADKRIGASQALVKGNKANLGLTTATKAEKYLERAVDQEVKARKAGKETRAFLEKLQKSCAKHEEILREMAEEEFTDNATPIQSLLDYPRRCSQEVLKRLNE